MWRERYSSGEVKGHATELDVQSRQTRRADKEGNDADDAVAALGRRKQTDSTINAKRSCCEACKPWFSHCEPPASVSYCG